MLHSFRQTAPGSRICRLCLIVAFGLWAGLERPVRAQSSGEGENRFNVLFIAIDDLRPELGAYGVSYVDTPHIDRLASEGVTFLRHYVQVPTCGASRYALLTGRSPSRSGVTRNNNAFFQGEAALQDRELPAAQSMPELFRRSGYRTVGIGKISHTPDGKVYAYDGSGDGRPELPHAWEELPTPYGPWEYGWGGFFAYPGGMHREDGQGNADLMNFEVEHDEDLPDGLIARTAIEKLAELKERDQPFFMGVGFYKPHLPFVAPRQDWDAVAEWDVPPPAPFERIESPYWHGSGEFHRYDMPFEKTRPLAPAARMQSKRAYLAALRYVDRQVGRVLDALEEEGLADSTIVVLWGDHGWFLGEFALWGKHALFERGVHSPLILRAPGNAGAGRATEALVETIDLYPTLIDLCRPRFGQTQYELDGRSLAPLLDGQSETARDVAVSYWQEGASVRSPTHRLIARGQPGQWRDIELYDMRQGPDSGRDLSAEQPERTDALKKRLPGTD